MEEPEKQRRLVSRLMAAGRVGLLLDVDGTLSPIVERPGDARLQSGARETLERLAGQVAVIAVITGRAAAEGSAMVDVAGVLVMGSYGLGDLPPLSAEVLGAVDRIAAEFPGVRVERKDGTVAVHLRESEDPDRAEPALAVALLPVATKAHMEIARGKRVLELVPAGRDLKGEAVERIIDAELLGGVLYAGDDLADVGAFAALERAAERGVVTVKVAVRGPETPVDLISAADLVVEGPQGVVSLLRSLLA